jgi:hypothetical protein
VALQKSPSNVRLADLRFLINRSSGSRVLTDLPTGILTKPTTVYQRFRGQRSRSANWNNDSGSICRRPTVKHHKTGRTRREITLKTSLETTLTRGTRLAPLHQKAQTATIPTQRCTRQIPGRTAMGETTDIVSPSRTATLHQGQDSKSHAAATDRVIHAACR